MNTALKTRPGHCVLLALLLTALNTANNIPATNAIDPVTP